MAKTDVNLYFLQLQNQYFEELNMLPEFKSLAAEGIWSEEQYETQLERIQLLKQNYERLAYVMWLLAKPKNNKKITKSKKADLNSLWYTSLKGASKEAVINENADILADFKKLIKEGKESLKNEN